MITVMGRALGCWPVAVLGEAVIVVSEGASSLWYERPAARVALANRDVCAVYLLLQQEGVSQREIARRTGQSQSEVSNIVAGRAVRDVTVLERICDGLGVPRELMRLWGGAEDAYPDEVTDVPEEVEEMRRRDLLAVAVISVAGRPVDKLGELLALPEPARVPLPARLEGVHVAQVRNLTRRLGAAGNPVLADPEVLSATAAWAERLLSVPGAEPVRRALMVAIAELHMEAAWAGFDAWHYDRATHHFRTALQLAIEAGDTYLQAEALIQAGAATREFGPANDGLKLLQLGQVKACDIPHDERRAVVVGSVGRVAVQAVARVEAAKALADLGDPDAAESEMAEARELWSATSEGPFGDLDRPAARLALCQRNWTPRNRSRRPQYAAGRVSVCSATPNRASCWPPFMCRLGNPAVCRWPIARSLRWASSAQSGPADSCNRLPLRSPPARDGTRRISPSWLRLSPAA
jgi:transcriptional regulator with XRE-family HTH domain